MTSHPGESKTQEKELLEHCIGALGQVFGKRAVRIVPHRERAPKHPDSMPK